MEEKEAKIISLANQKGGVGKTTMTAILVKELSQNYGAKILVIDADPQQSAAFIYKQMKKIDPENPPSYDLVSCTADDIKAYCKEFLHKYDYIFLDLPGYLFDLSGNAKQTLGILIICDLLLVPVKAGVLDIASLITFKKATDRLKDHKSQYGLSIRLTAFQNQYKNDKENEQLIDLLKGREIETMNSKISMLKDYDRWITSSIALTKKTGLVSPKTRNEVNEFTEEVYKIIKELKSADVEQD